MHRIIQPSDISPTESVVLGYSAAGWTPFEISEQGKGKKVYGFGNPPIKPEDSIYHEAHQPTKLISPHKINAMDAHALTGIIEAIESLSLESKQHLIDAYNQSKGKILTNEIKTGQSMIDYLTAAGVKPGNFVLTIADRIDSPNSENLISAVKELNLNRPYTTTRIDEYYKKNYQTCQETTWTSKQVIVDTLQENIRRYYNNEQLIPIKMLIRSKRDQGFSPQLHDIKNKSDVFITPSEIRAIYKLMNEIPNDAIKEIMGKTTFFFERTDDNRFVETDSPWKEDLWTDRPRGQRGLKSKTYAERSPEEIPQWIKDLSKLQATEEQASMKRTMSTVRDLDGTDNQNTSSKKIP